jgi:hypothetical protein
MYERVRQSPVTPYDGRSDRDRDVPVPDLSTYSKVVRACCGKFAVMTMVGRGARARLLCLDVELLDNRTETFVVLLVKAVSSSGVPG